ncbi:hypothetical protein [Candidatus Contubernalis alkaliaceticus]|uniref:hypothetical protein n=1 Tax=Candidatus Contubernalis alkaliaceticus TaxID=338645 RepID=UPI001F4C0B12|nr:hypothetical protein [Candidatus Contubernalis alkalaceticus]UNC91019.1 hypothetical protein HUE98_02325 [Candidatus Contubernalis alkalaceticus]
MDDFLKHPKVQYIPLSINNLTEGDWKKPYYNDPEFYLYLDHEELSAKLSHLEIPNNNIPLPEEMKESMIIIVINFRVLRGYFRFLTTKFIGEEKKGYFQVFYVTKKYFPKRVLYFTLYNEEGDRVAWENIEIIK